MARLQHRFSPRRIRLGLASSTPLGGGGSDNLVCVVGRELCLFTTVDASKAPRKQRGEFAALAVRRAAPFPDPEFDAAWASDGTAAVWYWSRSRVNSLSAAEHGRRKRFVAEALYIGGPRDEGEELFQLVAGVEARAWNAGHLQASRWWPEAPSLDEWRAFLRGAGHPVSPATTLPEPVPAVLADVPWSQLPSRAGKLELSGLEQYLPRIAFGLGAILLLVVGVELGNIARAQADIWRGQSAATDLDAPLKRILDARETTDKAGAEIASLLSLHGLRPTTSLMAELTRLMPGKDWQIKKWAQPTTDTVEVTLIAPASDPEALVSTWEASPMFKGVTTELGRENELTIKATITPPASRAAEEAP